MPLSPSSPRGGRRIGALVFVIALLAAACGSSGGSDEIALGEGTGDSGAAPASDPLPTPTGVDDVFTTEFRDFNGGETSLSGLAAGKPVVLNFFASWCPNCVAEMPDFEVVNQALGDDVQLIGLATSDEPGAALGLVNTTGVTYPLGLDPGGEFFNVFEGLGMPTTAFLTADGEVAHVFTGQLSTEGLTDRINEHLL